MTYISGIVAFFCLVGYSITMPHPLLGGDKTVSDIFYVLFMVFAGLTAILYMENK